VRTLSAQLGRHGTNQTERIFALNKFGMATKGLRHKTAVRAGFGIYYDDGQIGNLGTPIGNLTTKYTLTQEQAPGLSYPTTTYLGAVAYSFSPSSAPINRRDTASNSMDAVCPKRDCEKHHLADFLLRK
jgi:hypothetical protein